VQRTHRPGQSDCIPPAQLERKDVATKLPICACCGCHDAKDCIATALSTWN
jgi:hypothetical protein